MVGLALHHWVFLESILAPLISETPRSCIQHYPHALRVVFLSAITRPHGPGGDG
jgi:hypothetical protein